MSWVGQIHAIDHNQHIQRGKATVVFPWAGERRCGIVIVVKATSQQKHVEKSEMQFTAKSASISPKNT